MHNKSDIDYELKQGDTSPSFEAQLTDENGDPINLGTASSVDFHMKHVYSDGLTVDASATIQDSANGVVLYPWADGDTDTTGLHIAEWEVVYSDGTSESFPNDDDILIYINEDVA